MSLRIAFDLDGVLADMDGALAREAKALFVPAGGGVVRDTDTLETSGAPVGDTVRESALPDDGDSPVSEIVPPLLKLQLTSRQTRRLWRHVEQTENFWETLDEIEPGTVARIASIAADRRWELIFLTRRPETKGATSQVQTQRWLEAKGLPLPSVYVVQRSRGRIAGALALDIVVDDRPENCLDVVIDSKARAILVWRDPEKTLPAAARRLGIGVVASVRECLDVLTLIDNAPEPTGVVDRLLRRLGLRGESGAADALLG